MTVIWDEQHLKALLRLPRYPKRLLNEEPWAGWLRERGGASVVRASLRQVSLLPVEQQLLELILNSPHTAPRKRAAELYIGQSTYFRYLDALVSALVEYLNTLAQEDRLSVSLATNLPVPLTPLVGAETTLQNIIGLLSQPQVRLVTLVGTGGIGKTRLAIQTARRILESDKHIRLFRDGIFWVDLAPLRAPDLVLVEIARVLNLSERSDDLTPNLLQRELRERKLLLLLDNFEHLLSAAPLVAELLQGTNDLKVLVTSRSALNISGEHRLSIPLLGLPIFDPLPALEHLSAYSAIQLFVQRAQAIDETFQLTPENALATAQLCAALDGLPLALEMAAKRLSHLSPQEMLTMVGQRLHLLAGNWRDFAPRHQTLRSLIDWSYQLLDANQQRVFRSLAVFANGWTLDAMEAVCIAKDESGKMKDEEEIQLSSLRQAQGDAFVLHPFLDILSALINQSIIFRQSVVPVPRFGMLETIREYAQEKLAASGEEAVTRQRHAAYYFSLVEAWAQASGDPPVSIVQLESEYHNLRIALQWAIEQNQSELALEFAVALWPYWTRGSPNEGQYWLGRVLAVKPSARSPKRIRALLNIGEVALYQGNVQQAQALYEEAAALARDLDWRYDLADTLQGLGEIAQFRGDYSRARLLYLESLALHREIDGQKGMGWALDRLGNLTLEQGLLEEASAFFSESLQIFEVQAYPDGVAHAHAKLGLIAFEQERYAEAAELFESSLTDLRPLTVDWHYAWLMEYLGQAVLALGDLQRAASFFRQSLKIQFEGRAFQDAAYSLHGLALVALAEGQPWRAVRLLSCVQLIFNRFSPPPPRRRQLDATLARSRSLLDAHSFRAAWREGQRTPFEGIVAEELGSPQQGKYG